MNYFTNYFVVYKKDNEHHMTEYFKHRNQAEKILKKLSRLYEDASVVECHRDFNFNV